MGDEPADGAAAFLQSTGSWRQISSILNNGDVASLATADDPLGQLARLFLLPDWADPKLVRAGNRVFTNHWQHIMPVLGLYSLPYCYAGAKGARVLVQSQKIMQNPEKRLLDTAAFVWQVCEPGAFDTNGKAMVALFKTRLYHALVRLQARTGITDECPVNQEDMAGTLLAFSLLVIRGLRKWGIPIDEREAQGFFHLWRVAGVLLGVSPQLLPENLREAASLERYIRIKEFRSSTEGSALMKGLLDYYNGQPELNDFPLSASELVSYMLGPEVSACFGLSTAKAPEGLVYSALRLRHLWGMVLADGPRQLRDFQKQMTHT